MLATVFTSQLQGTVQISPKKGMAFPNTGAPQTASYKDLAASLNIAWTYNWGTTAPTSGLPSVTSYVPQIWGSGTITNQTMTKLALLNQQGMDNILLGFNEPDFADQSNLTVAQAINLWPQLVKTGRRIGSPAMGGYAPTDNSWLDRFMKAANSSKLKVDFVNVHWYGTPQYGSSFLDMVDATYKKFGLPIWVTEFAAADWSASSSNPAPYTQQDAINFMKVVIPGLLNRTYVERFAWFTPIKPSDPIMGFSAVFNIDGSLTEVGKVYAQYGLTNVSSSGTNPQSSTIARTSSKRTNDANIVTVVWSTVLMMFVAVFFLL